MECFAVYSNEIEGRIDPHFYRPEFLELYERLSKSGHSNLGKIIEFSCETWNQNEFFDNEFPYIEISKIDTSTGEIQDITYYEKNNAPSRAKMMVRENDIIVSTTRPHRGAITSINKEKDGFIASTGFAVLRNLKISLNKKYLLYILRTQLSLKQMLQRSSGGSYPAITSEELKKIIIPLPPISIQDYIVQIMDNAYKIKKQKEAEAQQLLGSIDEFVLNELGIKIPELKDKMCYAVNSQDFENKRIDAYYHHPKFEEVEEAIEKGKYQIRDLKEFIEFIPGFAFSSNYYVKDSGTKLLTIKNIKKDGIDFSNVTLLPNDFYDKFAKFQIIQDDILFAMTGATIGKVNIFKTNERVLLNQRVGILRVIDNKINNYYLFSFMNTIIFKNKIIRQSCGGAQPNISESEITSMKIPVPPLFIQNKIAEEVKRRMQKAGSLQKEAKQLLQESKAKVEKMILSG